MTTDLDFNNLARFTAEGDKEVTANFGVYGANASFTVFKGGSIAAKGGVSKAGLVFLVRMLKKSIAAGPDTHTSHQIFKWDRDNKRNDLAMTIVIGKNDKGLLYLGISAPNFSGTRFPFRVDLSWGSTESVTEAEKSEVAAQAFINTLETEALIAICLTSQKRDRLQGGGKQQSYGSNNNNKANAYSSSSDTVF